MWGKLSVDEKAPYVRVAADKFREMKEEEEAKK